MRQTISGLSNPIAVGDRVLLAQEGEDGDTTIEDILPRNNYIIRRSPRNKHHKHIVAANLDQAFLVVTLSHPRTSLGFIDRFLVNTGTYHIPTALVFNKADRLEPEERVQQQETAALYRSLGHAIFLVSAKTGEGLPALREALRNKVTLLAGHSGVGKSSLANALEPGLGLKVREVSTASGKGMHTTTFATMHTLDMGGFLVDTPGIKEFGIVDLEREEVGHYFPEIAERMEHCRFHNCLHLGEPDCAVLEALDRGEIAGSRFDSYQSILEDTGQEEWG
jgi:ribosome biogenesis GTPase